MRVIKWFAWALRFFYCIPVKPTKQHYSSRNQILTCSVVGSLVIGIACTFAPPFAQIALLGCYVSILVGVVFALLECEMKREQQIEQIAKSFGFSREIAQQSMVFQKFEKIVSGIAQSLQIEDPLFRELALRQLERMGDQSSQLSNGVVEFSETESWRLAYERLLRCEDVHMYQSVALITSSNYWQDEPGNASIQLNYELQNEKGLSIERTAIVSDSIWKADSPFPDAPIDDWIYNQHNHGIWFELVRESELESEKDLLVDTGIYGDRAVGTQHLDLESKTTKFYLSFNPHDVSAARARWARLKLFSISVRKILDQI